MTVKREDLQRSSTFDWLEDALVSVCRNAFPREASLQIHSLQPCIQRISPHRNYSFLLQSPDTEIRLVLRLYYGLFSLWTGSDRIKPAREYSVMMHVYQSGVPAPFPYGFTTAEHPFGKPYLLHDPGDGERWWDVDDSLRNIQREMALQLANELAKIHTVVPPNHPLIPTIKPQSVMCNLWNRISKTADKELRDCFAHCRKELELISPLEPVLLHGQFDLDHLLLQKNRIRTIVDWEHAAFGDPRWDLAHTSLSLQLGNDRSLANQFISRYSQLIDCPIENMNFWEGMTALRNWGFHYWLKTLNRKSYSSITGLQNPSLNVEGAMRRRALHQFG